MIWAAGTILANGTYQILDELSRRGGFGMTYRAKHLILGSTVVIKAPHAHRRNEPNYGDFVRCFVKEGKMLEKVAEQQHPNIVKVRGFFYEGDVPCMVMNYVEGETLEDLVTRNGAIPEAQIVSWIATIAEALSQVHRLGLVHRDANPANIIIKPDNQPVLIDFGIALNIQPRATTTMAAFAGHKTFAPLEQLEQEESVADAAVYRDPKLDIYCLAATLYFGITGEYPKGAYARQISFNKKRKDALKAPSKIKPEISKVVNRAILVGMAFHAEDRPASMAQWREILIGKRSPLLITRRKLIQYGALGTATFGIVIAADQVNKAIRRNERLPLFLPAPPAPSLTDLPLKSETFSSITIDEFGKNPKSTEGSKRYFEEDLGNSIRLKMVVIPGGSFLMGSPDTEALRSNDEGPQHKVNVPDFLMGELVVTQAQWAAVASLPQVRRPLTPNPAFFGGQVDHPIERVNWLEAMEFCDRLAKQTNRPYRLPSEAEWEYACRAGTTTPFHLGPTITTDLANYRGTDASQGQRGTWLGNYGKGPKGVYRGQTVAANEFPPNAFGLHNMHGNVWEWCLDNWHSSYEDAPTDGSAWLENNTDENNDRVARGGAWNISPQNCRSAVRYFFSPVNRGNFLGFRVVCVLRPQDSL